MSITYNIKKQGITGSIPIPNLQVNYSQLVKILSEHLVINQKDLLITNPITGQKFMENQTLKDKYSVNIEKITRTEKPQINRGIVSNQQLAEMAAKARFFMIKSSNQENIQKARQHSVWATTFSNQDKLRSALLYTPHIFLFFATNRSSEIKGLARMETEPSKVPDKGLWSGVSNIRLGGNFQIKWIRKKPLTSLQIQKCLGTQIRDKMMRLSDGEQVDGQMCQKVIQLFQVPTQPYYKVQVKKQIQNNQVNNNIPTLGDIIGARQVPIQFPIPFVPILPGQAQTLPITKQKNDDKDKKKKRKSKSKKKRQRSESSDSSSSSRSRSRKKKKKNSHSKSRDRYRDKSRDRKDSKKHKKYNKKKKDRKQKKKKKKREH